MVRERPKLVSIRSMTRDQPLLGFFSTLHKTRNNTWHFTNISFYHQRHLSHAFILWGMWWERQIGSLYFVRMSIRNLKASKIMSWLTRCWSRWTKGLFVRSSSIVLWQVVFKVLLDSLLLLWIWHCEWHKNWVGKLVNLCELQFSFSARRHSDPKLAKKYSWPT